MEQRQALAWSLAALALMTSLGAALAPGAGADGGGAAAPGQRLVVAFHGAAPTGLDRYHGASILREHPDTLVVRATPEQHDAILRDPAVAIVEPDRPLRTFGSPNDPKYPQQWGPPAIQAADAWDVTGGTDTIRIAVIDTGIDTDHEDRPTSLVLGPDYGNNDHNPEDANGHGTWVAGIVAGARDNQRGTAGLANVEILVIKVFADNGIGYTSYLDQGIAHAVASGAHIITMSLGFDSPDALIKSRVQSAASAGVLLIAAAGNTDGGPVMYPAAYPEVIAVGSVDQNLDIAAHSSIGPTVELTAPGVSIKGPWRGGGYASATGTSGAAPHVAGVAGLIWSLAPGLDATQVRTALTSTALDRGPVGRDTAYGYGIVQAYDALTAVFDHIPGESIADTAPLEVDEGTTVPWHVAGVPIGARGFAWSLDGDDTFDDGDGVTKEWSAFGNGMHQVAVRYSAEDTEGVIRRDLTVRNVAPTIHGISGGTEAPARVPLTLTIDASDPVDPLVFHIDWDDGTSDTTTLTSATHTWTQAGTYTVRVTADDGDGGTDTATHLVRIGDDGHFAPGSLHVRHDALLPLSLLPLEHPTRYLVAVDVVLETGQAVDDVRVDFVVRRDAYIETFATVYVDAPAAGIHTISVTVPLDLTTQTRTGTYRVDARLDPTQQFVERIETNNSITTTLQHLV